MKYFKRILELVGKNRRNFLLGLWCAFIKGFSFMFIFAALHIAFENIGNITPQTVAKCTIILLVGVAFHFVFRHTEDKLVSAEGYNIFKNYRLNAGIKLKKAPMGYFNEQKLGNIEGAMTATITSLENYTMMLITNVINGFGIAIVLTIGFSVMHYSLGLFMLPLLVIVATMLKILYATANEYVPRQHDIDHRMNFAVIDMIRGISVLRTFPKASSSEIRDSIQNKSNEIYEECRDLQIKCENAFSGKAKAYGFVLQAASVSVIVISMILFSKDLIKLADALTMVVGAYIMFLGMGPLSDASFLYVKVPSNQAYLDSVLDIPAIADGKLNEIKTKLDISFENVEFSYNKDRKIIKNMSFDIKEGQKVAIVGPSGSGKTTIVNLISRFWDIQSGSIRLAGKDIREYPTELLLRQLSMVFQDVYLFNDSVMENLRFAKPEASDEEIIEVCKKARCHEFISELPNGYATVLGEGGATISGGEKQRISIARALLKDAPIILLDEATSSVDPENEAEILAAIAELCRGKTVISIAHRLSTVENADNILVIDDGRLAEQGKHAELIKQKGIYAGFVNARHEAKGWKIAN